MPSIGGGGLGRSTNRRSGDEPETVEELERQESGVLGRVFGEATDLLSNLPRAVGEIGGSVLSTFIAEPVRTVVPGGDRGFLEETPQEAPDLLDDIGLGGFGRAVDIAEARVPVIGSLVSPLVESFGESTTQTFGSIPSPFTRGPLPFAARQTAGLFSDAEVNPDAGIVESLLAVGDASGNKVAGEVYERAELDREKREDLILTPFIEDVGNVALAAGGVGVAARPAGAALTRAGATTTGARLTNIGRTASAVSRRGPQRGIGALEEAGMTVSPTGQALGQISRPLRSIADTTPYGNGVLTGALRQRASDRLQRMLAEQRADGDVNPSRILEAAASWVNPRRAELSRLQSDQLDAEREAINSVRQGLSEPAVRIELGKKLRNVGAFLNEDQYARVQSIYARIADASDGDLPSEIPTAGFGRDLAPTEQLAILDAMAEANIPLRTDALPVEQSLNLDMRGHARDLARLALHEQIEGLEPGTLLNSLRAVHEMDSFAYTVAQSRRLLEQEFGTEAVTEMFNLDPRLDEVRLAEQTLPDNLSDASITRLQQAANSYREYQGGIERARIGADLVPEERIGSRLDPEGEVLPGDAPTRFEGQAPNAPTARRLARAGEKLEKAEISLRRLNKAIDESGGLENLTQVTQLAEERSAVYRAMSDALNEITQSADLVNNPAAIDSVLNMVDSMIEVGADLDRMATGSDTIARVADAQTAVRESVQNVRRTVDTRRAELRGDGTPFTRVKTQARTLARTSRNVNADNALESVTAMGRAVDEMAQAADELGLTSMSRPLREIRRTLDSFDDVRNQRLTNQQRLRSLLLDDIDAITTPSNRVLVETLVEDGIRQIGTSDGAVQAMLNRIARRLEVEQVPINRPRLIEHLQERLNTSTGRDIRRNLPTNVPRERRQALKSLTAVTRDMLNALDEVDPVTQSIRDLRSAQQGMTRARNQHLRNSNFASEVKRAKNTAAERAKLQRHVAKAQQTLDEARAEWAASPAAVPRAGRTLVTYANEVFPEVVANLRAMDDPIAMRLADDLDAAPRSLEELVDARVLDPATGEERALQVTYAPDIPDTQDRLLRGRRTQVDDLRETTESMSRRQRVSDRPQVEDPFELAQQQATSTVRAILKRQFRDRFTEDFTRPARDILDELGEWDDNLTTTQIAERMRREGYVEYKPNDLFGPFRESRYSAPQGRWVKSDIARAMEKHNAPRGAFDELLEKGYDPIINTWKGSVLALRPLWHINNFIGNAALAVFAGKVSPVDYMRFVNTALDLQRRAKHNATDNSLRLLKAHPLTTVRAARGRLKPGDVIDSIDLGDATGLRDLFDNSLLAGELRDINDLSPVGRAYQQRASAARVAAQAEDATAGQRARGAVAATAQETTGRLGRLANASYRVNSAVDDMNRALVYIAKGFEDPATGRVDFARAFDPTEGVHNSIRAFGAYNAMSPFERRVLRRIFPFYTWMRHITGVLARHIGSISEIDRTLLFGHIVNVIGEPNAEEELLPEWGRSQVFTGYNEQGIPEFYNPRGTDPFSEGLAPFEALGSGRELAAFIARSGGPFTSSAYERITGLDVLQGTPLTGVEGPRGEAPTPGLGQQITEAIPQARLLRDFIRESRGDMRVRLDDDTPIDIVRDPFTSKTTIDQFLRYMGISTVIGRGDPLPVEQIREQEENRLRDYIRARERAEEPA